TIQILCGLMISSLGAILLLASDSSHFDGASTTTLKTWYPLGGDLCFAFAGSLSIIRGKISTKPFAMSSLTCSALGSAAAVAGLFLLIYSLVGLEPASQGCTSGNSISSSSDLKSHDSVVEDKDCLLAYFSIA
uniref:Uncharacterized protein n=1 Tax=Jaculus jaculus TaxID=51337 RepID=A0A8C5KPB1_JACJA